MKRKTILLITWMLLAAATLSGAFAEPILIPVRHVPEEELRCSREEALSKAAELFAGQGYTYDAEQHFRKAGSVLLPNGRTAWVVIIEKHSEEPIGNLYAVLSGENGEVIEQYFPENDVYTWALLQWIDAKDGYSDTWPVEDKALFSWLFTESDNLFDPSRAAVSAEEAVRIAGAWAGEHFGIQYDDTGVSFICYGEDSCPRICWVISFRENGNEVMVVHVDTDSGEIVNSFDPGEGIG